MKAPIRCTRFVVWHPDEVVSATGKTRAQAWEAAEELRIGGVWNAEAMRERGWHVTQISTAARGPDNGS